MKFYKKRTKYQLSYFNLDGQYHNVGMPAFNLVGVRNEWRFNHLFNRVNGVSAFSKNINHQVYHLFGRTTLINVSKLVI